MRNLLLWVAVVLVTSMVSSISIFAQETAPEEGADGEAPNVQIGVEDVVARVGGQDIQLLDLVLVQQSLPQAIASQPIEEVYGQLLELVIQQKVFSEQAMEDGIADDENFQRRLKLLEERLLSDAYTQQVLEEKINQELLDAEIATLAQQIGTPETVTASHILISDKSNTALAEDLIARIQNGEDFGELASEYSEDPGSAANAGSLGTFTRGRMVPEFEEAAFSQEIGIVSAEPIESQFGLHIILVENRGTISPDPQQIAQLALQRLQERELQSLTTDLYSEITILTINEEGELVERTAQSEKVEAENATAQ